MKKRTAGARERLGRLSMYGLPLEDALRGAMQVPPPNEEPRRKAKPAAKKKPGRKRKAR